MVTEGPKHVASHTIKYYVFGVSCFITLILILRKFTSFVSQRFKADLRISVVGTVWKKLSYMLYCPTPHMKVLLHNVIIS